MNSLISGNEHVKIKENLFLKKRKLNLLDFFYRVIDLEKAIPNYHYYL